MHVLVLHSALGLRAGVHDAMRRLEAAGHSATAPDLYAGRTFADVGEGVAHADELGWPVLQARTAQALPGLPDDLAVLGTSMGAGLALEVAATRPGVRGALLLHAAMPWDGHWPAVPVEAHHSVGDRWVDEGQPAALCDQVARAGARASLHVYPGDRHLFTDPGLPDEHVPADTELLWQRALAFLGAISP